MEILNKLPENVFVFCFSSNYIKNTNPNVLFRHVIADNSQEYSAKIARHLEKAINGNLDGYPKLRNYSSDFKRLPSISKIFNLDGSSNILSRCLESLQLNSYLINVKIEKEEMWEQRLKKVIEHIKDNEFNPKMLKQIDIGNLQLSINIMKLWSESNRTEKSINYKFV